MAFEKKFPKERFSPLTTERVGTTDEGRIVYRNQDGSFSSERSVTVGADGKFYNIPTIFGGKEFLGDDAFRIIFHDNGGIDPETGKKIKAFNSEPEALKAAEERSKKMKINLFIP